MLASLERKEPTFLDALRGVWALTWKSQLTVRRVPVAILAFLILPVLVYITTSSLEKWQQRRTLTIAPAPQLEGLARRLARSQSPLQPEQRTSLLKLYNEEQLEDDRGTPDSAIDVERRVEQLTAAHERILSRAEGVLDDRQYRQFRNFENRRHDASLATVRQTTWNRTEPFYHWLIDFYFFVLLPLNCVRASGALINEELQADTLRFLVTRPVSRARLLIVKYISQTVWLEIVLLIETLLIFVAGFLREIPALGTLLPLFLASQFLAVLAWSALGTFFGQASKKYMAIAMVYGLIIETGIGRIPTNINNLSLMRHLKTLLSHNAALQTIYEWPGKDVPLSVAALLVGTALFLTLAALLFTFREYHRTTEMQK
jgi:hypothetical protein